MKSGNSCFIFAVETVSSHHAYSLDWKSMYLCGNWNTGAMRIPNTRNRLGLQRHLCRHPERWWKNLCRRSPVKPWISNIHRRRNRRNRTAYEVSIGVISIGLAYTIKNEVSNSRIINRTCEKMLDWGIFEKQDPIKNWNRCQTKTPQQLDTVHLILDYWH